MNFDILLYTPTQSFFIGDVRLSRRQWPDVYYKLFSDSRHEMVTKMRDVRYMFILHSRSRLLRKTVMFESSDGNFPDITEDLEFFDVSLMWLNKCYLCVCVLTNVYIYMYYLHKIFEVNF